ncbi:hypothetical protein FHJ30_20730 [Arthrobacter sp. BB-1]|uniref:hypothetical protein n=1 Tax=unclassified Arthrobacter TaxID=235627 RepID=UPI0011121C6D|nr:MULTISPECIES: hypothetical protein [unclassified Arthrobacter]TNB67203.1 hypothetical protein FHJ30_20730 [Arthrobacter sp. BB-1]
MHNETRNIFDRDFGQDGSKNGVAAWNWGPGSGGVMNVPEIHELDEEALDAVQWGEAVPYVGGSRDTSNWILVLLDGSGKVLAEQEFSFAGDFLNQGLNVVAAILDPVKLGYKGGSWVETAQGYKAPVRQISFGGDQAHG